MKTTHKVIEEGVADLTIEDIVEASLDILHEAIQHTPLKLSETNGTEYNKGYIHYQDMVVRDVLDNTPKLKKLLTEGYAKLVEVAREEERERCVAVVKEYGDRMAELHDKMIGKAHEDSKMILAFDMHSRLIAVKHITKTLTKDTPAED